VSVVPHTHWDREWYEPFQAFRYRLVDLLDELLPRLDADPSYAHFMLDGQMAVVDDYLAIRPDAEHTIRRLASSGRLSVGPWYILMDEFLVSGESMVRNLQLGLERAAAFGGAMEVGYLPDMFGHVAQMPQLLRQFGLDHAVVWRGVPGSIDRSAFWWSSPDGSTVRAEYLPQGYGNGASTPDDAKALLARVDDFGAEWGDLLTGPLLWMNGTDHQMPQAWLGRVVAEANGIQDDYELVVCSLAEHLALAATDALPAWTGELRSGARSNLLMGVASNRVDVHQAEARASRALEQLAEPLATLFLPAEAWPANLLDEAWLHVIRNSAHDSICACSVDEVCDAVLHRFAEATQIGEGTAARALKALGRAVPGNAPVLVNPTPRARPGIAEVIVPGTEAVPGTQVVQRWDPEVVMDDLDAASSAPVILRELKYNARIHSVTLEDVTTGAELWRTERDELDELFPTEARDSLDAAIAAHGPGRVRIRIGRDPAQKLLVRVGDVPGYGWRVWEPTGVDATGQGTSVIVEGHSITNGHVTVDVHDDGTWSVDGIAGFGRIVESGDVGDTYNWCPPHTDVAVDAPESVAIRVLEAGPVRARIAIDAGYRWPARADGMAGRSTDRAPTVVTTTVEVQTGSPVVRVDTEWDNRSRDHRVRVHIPLRVPSATSEAECAFAIVERGLTAEGGATEIGLPTFPSRRFVRSGEVTIAHEGLLEYELVDIADGAAHALALTLLRGTGMLSQQPMTTRPVPAGPLTPLEGSQLLRPIHVRYAIQLGECDPYRVVDEAFAPLMVTRAEGGTQTTEGTALEVDLGAAQVSSLRRAAGRIELRVHNPGSEPTTVALPGRHGWLVDLRGRPIAPFETTFTLDPWQIATAALALGVSPSGATHVGRGRPPARR
jgi:mannosylglycerate hydrolase